MEEDGRYFLVRRADGERYEWQGVKMVKAEYNGPAHAVEIVIEDEDGNISSVTSAEELLHFIAQ